MSNHFSDDRELLVTESPVDCLSHFALRRPNGIVYAATSGAVTRRLVELLAQTAESMCLEVVLSFDADEPGEQYDEAAALHLRKSGIPCRIEKPARGKDWNELLILSGARKAP